MEKVVLMSNDLFSLVSEQNLLTLEFHKNEIDFRRDKVFFDDAFFKEIRDKNIRIRGKGPVEVYAYAVYWCAKKGSASIFVTDFNLSRDFEIYRQGNSYFNVLPPWVSVNEESDYVVVFVISSNSPDGHWDDETICKNVSCFRFAGSHFFAKSQNKSTGTMIGILGDPNSGKSVFSKFFFWGGGLRKYSDKQSVWTYDCDAAAPTADWYIYGLQRSKSQEETDVKINARKSTKRK